MSAACAPQGRDRQERNTKRAREGAREREKEREGGGGKTHRADGISID
jgi:hypothetical protein